MNIDNPKNIVVVITVNNCYICKHRVVQNTSLSSNSNI